MARIDIIDDWSATEKTGTFTYADGQSVGYTYSLSTGELGGLTSYTPAHIDDVAVIRNGVSLDVTFDDPAAGVSIAFGAHESNEIVRVSVDGQFIEIDDWIADGRIIMSGPAVNGDGSNLVNSNGDFDNNGSPSYNYITFTEPVSRVGLLGEFANVEGSHADILIDDQAVLPCFTAGTLIETANGPAPVETLQAGDMIKTKDHGFQPVKWVGGSRVYDAPVRIKAGTFGNARDLIVSPRHRMLLQGWQVDLMFNHEQVFATAGHLKNGTTIRQEPEGWVEYYHVLLDRHEVIYAEGAETESFFPDEASLNAMAKKTREELAQTVDLSTFGRTVRPTLTANQAMYLSRNMDLLEDEVTYAAVAE